MYIKIVTTMTTKSNIFANLDVDDEETNHRKKERKAIKK